VQHDAAKIRHAQDGHFDIAELINSAIVILLVQVTMVSVIDGLIASALDELVDGASAFSAVRT
jgi:hypothetical protein